MATDANMGPGPPGPPTPSPTDGNQTFDDWATTVVTTMNLYYTPLLVAVGCIGNLLSVFVFFTSKLGCQSTSQYLSALALVDLTFLLQLMPPWLSAVNVTNLFHRHGFCQAFVYMSYVSCCASSWLVVGFTVERYVAVLHPLQRNALCTVARARAVVLGVIAGAIALNLPVLRFAVGRENECNIDPRYLVHAARFNIVDTAVNFTIPLAAIVVLNAWITVGVSRLERQLLRGARHLQLGCTRSQQRVTRMLLLVSTVFVLLNLPAYAIRMLAYYYNMVLDIHTLNFEQDTNEVDGRWTAIQQLAVMFFHTNFGINFILYCMMGQNFRRALIQAVPLFRQRARRAAAAQRVNVQPNRASSISSSLVSTTEANVNRAAVPGTPYPPRRRPERFIKRWTFDNNRQRARSAPPSVSTVNIEEVEMRTFGI